MAAKKIIIMMLFFTTLNLTTILLKSAQSNRERALSDSGTGESLLNRTLAAEKQVVALNKEVENLKKILYRQSTIIVDLKQDKKNAYDNWSREFQRNMELTNTFFTIAASLRKNPFRKPSREWIKAIRLSGLDPLLENE